MGHYCTWVFVLIRGVTFGEGSLISGALLYLGICLDMTFGEGSLISGALLYLGICLDKRGDLW